jgi:hypothetical protein
VNTAPRINPKTLVIRRSSMTALRHVLAFWSHQRSAGFKANSKKSPAAGYSIRQFTGCALQAIEKAGEIFSSNFYLKS